MGGESGPAGYEEHRRTRQPHLRCRTDAEPLRRPDVDRYSSWWHGVRFGRHRSCCRAAGAQLRTGAQVRRILIDDGGAAVGVELADGQLVRARTVISNAHLLSTIGLVDDDGLAARLTQGAGPVDTDYAAMKFHAIVDELPDFGRWLPPGSDPRQLVHVNICPDLEYFAKSAKEAARAGHGPPADRHADPDGL